MDLIFYLMLLFFYFLGYAFAAPGMAVAGIAAGVFYRYVIAKKRMEKQELPMLILLAGASVLTIARNYHNPMQVIVISAVYMGLYLLKAEKIYAGKYVKYFIYLIPLSFYYQLETLSDGRGVLGNASRDPNFSGMIIFIFLLLAVRLNMKLLQPVIIILGLMTQSRAFMLGVIALYLFTFLFKRDEIWKLVEKFRLNKAYTVFGISLLFLIMTAGIEMKREDSFAREQRSLERIIKWDDSYRFRSNGEFLDALTEDSRLWIGGYGNSYQVYVEKNKAGFVPHNFIFHSVVETGLLSTAVFLWMLMLLLDPLLDRKRTPFFWAMIMYSLFLHKTFEELYLLAFYISMKAENGDEEWIRARTALVNVGDWFKK